MTHAQTAHRKPLIKRPLTAQRLRVTGLALLSTLPLVACSSGDAEPSPVTSLGGAGGSGAMTASGASGSAGKLASGGSAGSSGGTLGNAGGGAAGNAGSAGASATASGGAGASSGGGASGTGNAGGKGGDGSGLAGLGGTGPAGAGGRGGAGMGGMSGTGGMGNAGMGGMGIAGAGGAMDCAGHALSLAKNGTGSSGDSAAARVVVDLASDLPIGSSDRTLEYWAYTQDSDWTANTNTMFFYGPVPSARNADGFGLDFGAKQGTTGTIDPFTNAIFDNDNQSSGVTTTSAQWVHFAMTWNGTAVQAYVNGTLRATMTAPSSSTQKVLKTGTSPLTIGGYPGENAYFAGLIDEFRVWNVARSASDIAGTMNKTLTGTEAGLVGYWQFNEASGTTVADSTTTAGHTAHPGTLMAASTAQNPTFVLPTPQAPLKCP
jgi:hypothetical protein